MCDLKCVCVFLCCVRSFHAKNQLRAFCWLLGSRVKTNCFIQKFILWMRFASARWGPRSLLFSWILSLVVIRTTHLHTMVFHRVLLGL